MLVTVAAKIGFFIWVILQVAMYVGILWKSANCFGRVLCAISTVVTAILLFTQNWPVFFWYVLIATMITPFLPLTKAELQKKLTVSIYLFTVGFTYLLCYGAYGILYKLN